MRVADGVTPEQGYAIREVLNNSETIGWWFLNPGGFLAVFPAASPATSTCQAALARLAAATPSWPSAGVGAAEGRILGAFTSAGILESMPMGKIINVAMTRALEHSS